MSPISHPPTQREQGNPVEFKGCRRKSGEVQKREREADLKASTCSNFRLPGWRRPKPGKNRSFGLPVQSDSFLAFSFWHEIMLWLKIAPDYLRGRWKVTVPTSDFPRRVGVELSLQSRFALAGGRRDKSGFPLVPRESLSTSHVTESLWKDTQETAKSLPKEGTGNRGVKETYYLPSGTFEMSNAENAFSLF